ncbi:MAG: CBS domain-containing protein [Nitrososphaerota archaeon]|nr:CBS domain-containing protein [Nitrososphaerota archaeon]
MTPSSLKDIPITELVIPAQTLSQTDSVSKAIGILRESNAYEAFVEERERTAIVSVRDMLNIRDIATTKVSKVIHYVPRLTTKNTVRDAASLMFEYKIRSLPVHEANLLKGQITVDSIVQRMMDTQVNSKVTSLMTSSPLCLDWHDSVSKARRIMLNRKIDQIPVLNDGQLSGVISSNSILFNIVPSSDRNVKGDWRAKRLDGAVGDFSNKVVCTNGPRDSLNEVYSNMAKLGTQYSVITNFNEVQGIITYRDFLKLLVEPKNPSSIPMYIIGLPEDPFEAEASREKFGKIVRILQRSLPHLTEARAIIKVKDKRFARTKYEVQVFIGTVRDHFSYKGVGFDLPDVFDEITSWAKKLGSIPAEKRKRTRLDPGMAE